MPEYFDFGVISERYKAQKEFNGNIIYSNLFNSIIDMFNFEGLPDSIDKEMFFRFLYSGGMCAIPLVDNAPVCVCSRGGDINAYGYGDKIIATTQNGKSYSGIVGVDIALFKNNSYMYPEFYLLQTVDLLTELYTSLKCNIINSRLAPIGKAKTDTDKAAIEKAFIDIYKGKPATVKNTDLFGDNGDNIIENFTKPEHAAYIPYLSQLEDDILQKFYYHYGLNLNNVNKRAQVSAEEIQGADPLVWTVPLQKLSELEKGFKVLRKKWTNASVKFGSVWALEYEKFKRSYTQPEKQNNEDQSEEVEENENN